ncbi:MAG: LPS export ABC transporter permease LptF [Dongiaceae bacterium]
MTLLDRYILSRIMWPLFGTVAIALMALLLERMVRLLDFVVAKGGPIIFVLRMLANLIPHYLGLALPLAFFIGIILAISRLSADSEIDAMNATGVSLHRLVAPIMLVAIMLVACGSIIFGFLQPYTRYAYRALVYVVTETAWESALERGSFFTGFGNFTIMANDIADGGRVLSGIFVHEERPSGGSITTTAETGRVFRSTDDLALVLRLENGIRVDAGLIGSEATVLSFDSLTLPLDDSLGPSPFRMRGDSDREMTIPELWNAIENPPPDIDKVRFETELHARVVRTLSFIFLPLLAAPLAMTTRRSRRGVSLGSGIVILLIYHYLLQLGEGLSDQGRLSPWIALWTPFFVFLTLSTWCFWVTSVRPGSNPLNWLLSGLDDVYGSIISFGQRRREAT